MGGRSPEPGVTLRFLFSQNEPRVWGRMPLESSLLMWGKGLEETSWQQEGKLDIIAAFLVRDECGRGRGEQRAGESYAAALTGPGTRAKAHAANEGWVASGESWSP